MRGQGVRQVVVDTPEYAEALWRAWPAGARKRLELRVVEP